MRVRCSASWRGICSARSTPTVFLSPTQTTPLSGSSNGHPCGSVVWDEESKWTAHGPLRANASVLQVASGPVCWATAGQPSSARRMRSGGGIERVGRALPRTRRSSPTADGIVCLQGRGRRTAGCRPVAAACSRPPIVRNGPRRRSRNFWPPLAGGKRPVRSLDEWLRDRFFAEHCKLFHNRPFIWHIWDGRSERLSRSGQLPPPLWPGRRRAPNPRRGARLPPSWASGSTVSGRRRPKARRGGRRPPSRRTGPPTPVGSHPGGRAALRPLRPLATAPRTAARWAQISTTA